MTMSLAFSTLGCPGEPIADVVGIALEFGTRAVELRYAAGEPIAPGAGASVLRSARRALSDAGLEVACLASYVKIASAAVDPSAELLWTVAAARELDAPFVRIFGTDEPDPAARDRAVARLRALASRVEGSGVVVLLETHDAFPTGRAVAEVLEGVGSEGFGAIWDAVNPWRHGEQPLETAQQLGPWLRYVQLKDVASADDIRPVLPGTGTLPLHEILDVLEGVHYAGWLSLEWERAWFPEIEPLPEALAALRAVLSSRLA
jgi:sugar phosphate isomerase/epimerase